MTQLIATFPRHEEKLCWRPGFLKDVVQGLGRPQKAIPCKYLYDEAGSALFEEICELDEYYLTRTELAILDAHLPEMAVAIGEDCELIELGTGSGQKTYLLLRSLRKPRAYVPIDVDRTLLERTAGALAAAFPGLCVLPVHADFTAPLVLPETRGEMRAGSCISRARRSATSARGRLSSSCDRSRGWPAGAAGS